MIENLTIGKTYTLIEEIAPKNYKTAESINFTIDNNGTVVQKVVMYDELLPVKKYYMMLAGLAVVVFGMVYFRKKHA